MGKTSRLHYALRAPLNPEDTATQTLGCRCHDRSTCCRDGIENVCAYASEDHICKSPSKIWPQVYKELKQKEEEASHLETT